MALPPGYELDKPAGGLPAGYTLDTPSPSKQEPTIGPRPTHGSWATALDPHNDIPFFPSNALDLVQGIGSGINKTGYSLGDAFTRGTNALSRKLGVPERFMSTPAMSDPEIRPLTAPPPSLSGKIGHYGEQAAEFLIPGGAVSKGAKAVEGVTEGMRAAPLLRTGARALMEGTSAAGVEAAHGGSADDIKRAGELGLVAPVAGAALGAVKKPVINAVTDLLGKVTGAGGEAVRMAGRAASQKFMDAMRSKTSEVEIVNDLQSAVKNLKMQRSAEYQKAMERIDNSQVINPQPVREELMSQLSKKRVDPLVDPSNPYGPAAFGKTAITSEGDQTTIRKLIGDVTGWSDYSPQGMDTLKRRIYDYADQVDPKHAHLFYVVGDKLKGMLNTSVPGYKEMTGDYAQATGLLNNISQELSVNAPNPGTTIRKLSYALNQNNDYRRLLLEALDAKSGSKLKDEVAGYALRGWVPRGLAGVGGGIPTALGAAAMYLHNPYIAAGAAFSSPRVVGETMALLSHLSHAAPNVSGQTARMAGVGGIMQSLTPPPNAEQGGNRSLPAPPKP